MRQFGTALTYTNESAETRGTELEKTYAKLLGGRIVGGFDDGGLDIVFDDVPEVPLIQVKSSWIIARKSLAKSLEFMEFLPIVVSDPGQYKRGEIFKSIIDNGGWVGIGIDDREKIIGQIKKVRLEIFSRGERQKGFQ